MSPAVCDTRCRSAERRACRSNNNSQPIMLLSAMYDPLLLVMMDWRERWQLIYSLFISLKPKEPCSKLGKIYDVSRIPQTMRAEQAKVNAWDIRPKEV